MSKIKILAIESSADETSTAVGIGDAESVKFKLVSHIVYSQIKTHRKTGGIVPEIAARAHIPKIIPAIKLALSQARVRLRQIDAIAVTSGPGLITSLMVGVDTAKALAFALGKPIIPINHLEGHLLSALLNSKISNLKSKIFPSLGLVVSGGHTMLVLIKNIGQYKILGQTLDDAAGECFDKVAKILGLPYPGGPELAKLAKRGNPQAIDFPRPMINSNNFNFSFAGLKTSVLYHVQSLRVPTYAVGTKQSQVQADIAASAEQAIVDVLVEKTVRATKKYKVKTVLLGGGVSANKKLRKTLAKRIKKELPYSKFYIPHSSLTTDNAGMIALAGFHHFLHGHTTAYDKIIADPNLELKSWR
ncbi:MAG: tRNA (adenosine(37)-N6)-threonylcarbamoyltransferase complex transferase subunit TsaD [bacterium]|nr:tRNA (adenosine(37)-N6)-threonylcarbamoyltransferase complex transferase subunit TsaD [bacterium]